MDEPKPKLESVEQAVELLQSQPFPFVLVVSEGFINEEEIGIYVNNQVHLADGEHAGAISNCLRDISDRIEDEYFG